MSDDLSPIPDGVSYDVTVRSLQANEKVFGRYALRRVLGRGGMGVVWLGHDERLERDVALKFLPDEVYSDPGALDELKRETRRCLDLTHPNIIRIHDFIKDERAAAISMEYVDGKTLAEMRVEKDDRVFEVAEIRTWMATVCQALHYAHHEVGVVHRDLKPANIMLTSRGQVKVADFGIAQTMGDTMSRMTLRRGTSGTLAYMSPQQLGGELARPTDDVYAVGATIYELLTGKPPFSSGDISFQVRLSVPRSMEERRKELKITGAPIPAEWEQVVARCLSKVPGERPQTMLELSELLGLAHAPRRQPAASSSPSPSEIKRPAGATVKPSWLRWQPLPVRMLIKPGAIMLGVLGLVLVWIFVVSPLLAPPGKLHLVTTPSGVAVHIPGQPDQVTPAEFSHLRRGTYLMTLSAPGFDTMKRNITIASGKETNPGMILLRRTRGNLRIITVPPRARYGLVGAAETGNYQLQGWSPDFLSNLPAGRYQLTLSAPDGQTQINNFEISGQATHLEAVDLIQESLVRSSDAPAAKVFRGEMDAASLDSQGRSELTELYRKSFEDYLNAGLLAVAANQLEKIKQAGGDTSLQQGELDKKRAETENNIANELANLIADGRFGVVEKKLKLLPGMLEPESVDRLSARFENALVLHRKPISDAIQASKSEPPADAYAELKTLSLREPDNLDLQLAMADLQMRMPPDHDRLSSQLRNFAAFRAHNADSANDPGLLDRQASFGLELQQLDGLEAAKDAPANLQNEITRLESRKSSLEDVRIGRPKGNPFTQTLNFLGKAMTGHSVVDNRAYFATAQEKEETIRETQDQIDKDRADLVSGQASSADALKRYNDFVAQVPWGPGDGRTGTDTAPTH